MRSTTALRAFVLGSLLAGLLQILLPDLVGSDGYFHIRFASMGPAAWTAHDLPSMRYTVFDDGRWVDHQLLFHALQYPFTRSLSLVAAAKASTAIFVGLACAAWASLLEGRGVQAPLLWTLLLLGASSSFAWRMSMPRAQSLSLALLLIGLALSLDGRSRTLAVLGFAFAWTYHVCLLLIPLSLTGCITRRDWRPPVYAAMGIGLGLAIHPQSPQTFQYLWLHVILKVANTDGLVTGTEWLPLSAGRLLVELSVPLAVLAFAWLRKRGPVPPDSLAVGLAALGSLLLATTAMKWIEYAVPLLLLAAALRWRDHHLPTWPLWIAVLLVPARGLSVAHNLEAQVSTTDRLARVTAALPASDCRVFHANWADWAELYFHAPQCHFIVGLDPHFLALADPQRARLLGAASWGQVAALGQMADQAFDSDWVITTHPIIAQRAAQDDRLELVEQDGDAALWRVLPQPVRAPTAP